MRPCLENRRVIEVNANQSWEFSLEHRVYSCPDTQTFDHVLGATAMILRNDSGMRIPLEVSAIVTLAPDERSQLESLPHAFRTRLHNYETDIAAEKPRILQSGVTHRFYFLSEEPWPIWLQQLTAKVSDTEWTAILSICAEPDRFIEWPKVGTLLWPGCTRENSEQIHQYPAEVTDYLRRLGFNEPDVRSNGPAIMSFLAAGGRRPVWGNEGWPIHHIYDGTAPIIGAPPVVHPEARGGCHAVKDGRFFTHSSGLVAAHPVAHHLAHHSALLKWLLRREAFLRFGFDPDGVFATNS